MEFNWINIVRVEEEINCNMSNATTEMMGRIRVHFHSFNARPSEKKENTMDKTLLTEDQIKGTLSDE